MLHERIYLDPTDERVYIDTYVADDRTVPKDAMLVIPGGGYHGVCTSREGEPIALAYMARGFNCFVLHYRVSGYTERPEADGYPSQLIDASRAIAYIREHAAELNVNSERVFAVGFSAGGHLCGTLATLHQEAEELLGLPKDTARPRGVVLSYPVIYVDSHIGSFKNLFGTEDLTRPEVQAMSLERSVTPKNPPTFLWTTAGDTCVNPMATVLYTAELLKNKVKVESHIFADGEHGAACCDERTGLYDYQILPEAKSWTYFADKFLKGLK